MESFARRSSLSLASLLVAAAVAGPLRAQVARGSTWELESYVQITSNRGGFAGQLDDLDGLGISLTATDLNGDGRRELIAAVPGDDDTGSDCGGFWVLFLGADGTVASQVKVREGLNGLAPTLDDYDYFGRGIAAIGDVDGDGVSDILVGAYRDDDGGVDVGAAYVLFMTSAGGVKGQQKLSAQQGGWSPGLESGDLFGVRVAGLGDLDLDGVEDVAVCASFDDDGGQDRGSVYILFLRANGTVRAHQKISAASGGFAGPLANDDYFGSGIALAGDVDGDGVQDLAVGARGDDGPGAGRGAVWIVALRRNGTVKAAQKINELVGGFHGDLDNTDQFGISVEALGDVDGDGRRSIAVGAFQDDDGGLDRGAVWLLKLDYDGTVITQRKLSDTRGGFSGGLDNSDGFGISLAALSDTDQGEEPSLAVGAWLDSTGGTFGGAIWVLDLHAPDRLRGATGGALALAPGAALEGPASVPIGGSWRGSLPGDAHALLLGRLAGHPAWMYDLSGELLLHVPADEALIGLSLEVRAAFTREAGLELGAPRLVRIVPRAVR